MDRNLVYAKTPAGEEATLQRTRVVQRNLRMVLLQVDGQLNIAGLIEKIGNETLVFNALRELEKGGYIALSVDPPSVWEQGKQIAKEKVKAVTTQLSPFSVFEPSVASPLEESIVSQPGPASVFGKPLIAKKQPESIPPRETSWFGSRELRWRIWDWMDRFRLPPRDLKPYRRVSWGKRIGVGMTAIIALVTLAVIFFPYGNFRPVIERHLSSTLGVPVKVGGIELAIRPRPAFVFRNVGLGEGSVVWVEEVRIPPVLSLLSAEKKIIPEVELVQLSIPADFVAGLPLALERLQKQEEFAVERISLKNAEIVAGGVGVKNLNGVVVLRQSIVGGQVTLVTSDRSLQLHFAPADKGVLIGVEGFGWKPEENSAYTFGVLSAKGKLEPGRLVLQNAEVGFADGSFHGNWIFDWNQRLSMAGDGVFSHLNAKRLAGALSLPVDMEGLLSGGWRIRGSGAHWQGMWAAAEATVSFQMERAVVNGVNLGTAARRGEQSIRGGSTKFDRAKGNLVINAKQVSGSDIELDAGLVKARGGFIARPDRTVEGAFRVNFQSSVTSLQTPVRIFGTLPTLEAEIQ